MTPKPIDITVSAEQRLWAAIAAMERRLDAIERRLPAKKS